MNKTTKNLNDTKKKQKHIYFLIPLGLSVGIFLLFASFWSGVDPTEIPSHPNQKSGKQKTDPPSKAESLFAGKENRSRGEKNNLLQSTTSIQPSTTIFETFELSSSELDSFHKSRHETKESTLRISGLKIDKKPFQVETPEELPKKLNIPLPGGEAREFTQTRVDFKDKDSFVWVGSEEGNKLYDLHLSFYGEAVAGKVNTTKGSYEIQYLSRGRNVIRELNQKYYPNDTNDVIFPDQLDRETKGTGSGQRVAGSGETGTHPKKEWVSPNGGATSEGMRKQSSLYSVFETIANVINMLNNITVDVIVGYSQRILGGQDWANAQINLYVSITNTAHLSTHTGVTINLTETISLNVAAERSQKRNIKKMKDAYRDEDSSYDANNPYHILMRRRRETNSDLAALILHRTRGSCGVATFFPGPERHIVWQRSYGVSVISNLCESTTFAHELGHNFGCKHNRGDAGDNPDLKGLPYAYGYQDSRDIFRTLMSYDCDDSCPRLHYYSSATEEISLISMPFAIGVAGEAENARAIRKNSRYVRNFYVHPHELPQITQQPQGGDVIEGASPLTLSVTATSPASGAYLHYQWYRREPSLLFSRPNRPIWNQTELEGETSSTLTLNTSSYEGDSALYFVTLINDFLSPVSSDYVNVNFVRHPVQIIGQPQGGAVYHDNPLTLRVSVQSPPGLRIEYQWYKDGTPLSGETRSYLTVNSSSRTSPLTSWPLTSYYVEALFEINGVSSTIRSERVIVVFFEGPYITQQPRGGRVSEENPLELTVGARPYSGIGSLEYQWYKDGTPLSGETRSNLIIRFSSHPGSSATYHVEVLDTTTQVSNNSNKVLVQFVVNHQITQQPIGGEVSEGNPLELTVVAISPSGEPLKYQWYRDSNPLSGETRSNLILSLASHSRGSARYHVEVFGGANSLLLRVQSDAVRVRFLRPPEITGQPIGGEVSEGNLELTIVAISPSGEPLEYQWYRDGTPLSGETHSNLILSLASHSGDSAMYHMEVFVRADNNRRVRSDAVRVRFLRNLQKSPDNP